jgi:hypothetical protein
MRSDIASVLSRFVTAINAGDTTTASSMISAKPNVSAIVNGKIFRGAMDIANALSRLGAHVGHYQFIMGSMDIANVNGLGLATGPYSTRRPDKTITGSATFLLENQKGVGWVITHINLSRATP